MTDGAVCEISGIDHFQVMKTEQHENNKTTQTPDGITETFESTEECKNETQYLTEDSVICHQCGMHFTEQENLEQHMRVHTGEKPFSCLLCGKSFTMKQSLEIHMRIHSGEKPFTCSQCGKSFTQQGHLQRHERSHWSKALHLLSVWKECHRTRTP